MAKTISDEKMKLSVVIDSNQAQQELIGLEKATRSLTEENKTLLLEKREYKSSWAKSLLSIKIFRRKSRKIMLRLPPIN